MGHSETILVYFRSFQTAVQFLQQIQLLEHPYSTQFKKYLTLAAAASFVVVAVVGSDTVWPDWAIYWTLGNFYTFGNN